MFLKLRILFTILAALCVAAVLPAAVWGGGLGFALCALGGVFFFLLMLLCKQSQEKAEAEKKSKADFLNPADEQPPTEQSTDKENGQRANKE